MARYIDADFVTASINRILEEKKTEKETTAYFAFEQFKFLLGQAPTADVEEVVRCKNCDVPHNKWIGCPNLNGLIPHPDFYCAKGTPKERGGEKALKEREKE